MGRDRRVKGIRKGHLNVIDDLTDIFIKLPDLPMRIEAIKDAAILGLTQNPVRVLVGHMGDVSKAQLGEPNLDFAIESATLGFGFEAILYGVCKQTALDDPWNELIIVLNVFDNAEKVFLRVRQDLASRELDGFLFEYP